MGMCILFSSKMMHPMTKGNKQIRETLPVFA